MESGGEARLTHPTALETYRILSDEALADSVVSFFNLMDYTGYPTRPPPSRLAKKVETETQSENEKKRKGKRKRRRCFLHLDKPRRPRRVSLAR